MAEHHKFVLNIEDGHTSWDLICPDDGSCEPAGACAMCGRYLDDEEAARCYDCPTPEETAKEGCWAQSWVGEMMADEVLHGTIAVEFPVIVQWNGDGLEAHIAGSAELGDER